MYQTPYPSYHNPIKSQKKGEAYFVSWLSKSFAKIFSRQFPHSDPFSLYSEIKIASIQSWETGAPNQISDIRWWVCKASLTLPWSRILMEPLSKFGAIPVFLNRYFKTSTMDSILLCQIIDDQFINNWWKPIRGILNQVFHYTLMILKERRFVVVTPQTILPRRNRRCALSATDMQKPEEKDTRGVTCFMEENVISPREVVRFNEHIRN